MIFRRFAFLLVVVALLGCNNEKNRNLIDRRTDQAIRMGEEARAPAPKKVYNPLTVTDKVWAGNTSLRMRRGLPLPSKYDTSRGVTLIAADPMPINEIATAIGTQTGIPVRIAAGAGGSSSGGNNAAAMASAMPLAYEGPLSGLLDLVSGHFGLNWRYDGSSINFSRFETRVFVLETLPGTSTVKDSVKEDSSGGGSSGSSVASTNPLQQTTELNVEMKVWEEVGQTVSGILGGVGTAVVSPSSGTITVTTTPELMKTVSKFVEEENRRLSRQIVVNIEIYSVALEDNADYSVSLSTAFKTLTNFSGNITGIQGGTDALNGVVAGGGKLAMTILSNKNTGPISTVLSALSKVGDTSRVAQFPMTTLNNRPVSRRVGIDTNYVAQVGTSSSLSSSSTSVTPGTVHEGFSMQVTPRLFEDGRIMMQYSLSLIDLIKFDTFQSSGIQLPKMSSRLFVQQTMLRSGLTLVIGGFDDEQVAQTSQGVGSAYNYIFGGGSSNDKKRQMMFIAITPQVIELPMPDNEAL